MRTRSGRRSGWAAAVALATAAAAPAVAHAQQSGIFPLAPIRRERVPCPAEDPVYRLYRHEYFGYHPTCWRRFPTGWGCPSPEAPNPTKEFQTLPRAQPEGLDNGNANPSANPDGEMPAAEGPATPPAAGNNVRPTPNNLPPLPANSNPFNLDAPGGRGNANPAAPPDGPAAPPTANPPGADNPGPGAAAAAEASGLPPIAEPSPGPAANEPPALTLPEPTASFPAQPADTGIGTGVIPPRPPAVQVDPNSAGPFQAPRRPSLIGSLFNGSFFRR